MSSRISYPVAEAIHAASIRVLRIVRAEDTRTRIGPAQLSALSVLVFLGARTMGELAEAEQVKPPTMSRIVDGLVREGLAARTAGSDRRSLRIAATPRGKALLFTARDRRVRALAKRIEHLTQNDLKTLKRAAELLAEI